MDFYELLIRVSNALGLCITALLQLTWRVRIRRNCKSVRLG